MPTGSECKEVKSGSDLIEIRDETVNTVRKYSAKKNTFSMLTAIPSLVWWSSVLVEESVRWAVSDSHKLVTRSLHDKNIWRSHGGNLMCPIWRQTHCLWLMGYHYKGTYESQPIPIQLCIMAWSRKGNGWTFQGDMFGGEIRLHHSFDLSACITSWILGWYHQRIRGDRGGDVFAIIGRICQPQT